MQYAAIEGAIERAPVGARRNTEVRIEQRAREKLKTKPLFYASLTGAGAAAAVFGLFAGMLLPRSAAAWAVAGRDTLMGNSLFGMAVEAVRGSLPAVNSLYAGVLQLFLLLMAASAALSLACSVLAFAAGRTARKLSAFTLTLHMLTFGGFAGLVYLGGETLERALALDALFVFAAAMLLRVLHAAARRGSKGLFGSVFLLLAVGAFAGVCLPGAALKRELTAALSVSMRAWEGTDIALIVLLGSAALNLLFAVLRMGAGKGFAFELVRFLLVLSAAGAVVACFAAEEMSLAPFTPLPSLLVLAPAGAGLVLSAGLVAARAVKKKPKQ